MAKVVVRKITLLDAPLEVGSRWRRWGTTPREPEGRWSEPLKVMAIADGYAMCRFPRCMPFVVSIRDFADASKYRLVGGASPSSPDNKVG